MAGVGARAPVQLLHELAHVRGRDILLNAVLAGLRCLYWFHPLAPLAFARDGEALTVTLDRPYLDGETFARSVRHRLRDHDVRFDVIAVEGVALTHYEAAF